MTQKEFEAIAKNMIAAGMYLVYVGNNITGSYDVLKVVSNKTVITPSHVTILGEFDKPIARQKSSPYTVKGERCHIMDITSLRNPDMINDDYHGQMLSSLNLCIKLNDRFSLAYSVVEGESIPEDNGSFLIIDHQNSQIIYECPNYTNGKNGYINTVTWASIYGQINKFFVSADLINVVNRYVPGFIV